MTEKDYTDFGFEKVTFKEKRDRVLNLFDSVAPGYDLMNDLMSLGIHRLWKRHAVYLSSTKPGDNVLDVAGGTGDMARLLLERVGNNGSVTICDISHEMIRAGRDRLLDAGKPENIRLVQGDAENLPFADNTFDHICIAFGLRNVSNKANSLRSMYSRLKYGSKLMIVEFSRVTLPVIRDIYGIYSDLYIPFLGRLVAGNEDSYRYLVESIKMHPDQETLKDMILQAGFSRVEYLNLCGGIVAIHTAYKL